MSNALLDADIVMPEKCQQIYKQVYVSIGSNIEPQKYVNLGIKLLRERFDNVVCSPLYQTTAVGFDGDDFLNGVLGFRSSETLAILSQALRDIEQECGRVRGSKKFSARTLDIDLLIYGDLVEPNRNIPRDEITKYAFVLKPLADLAPNDTHPVEQKCYAEMWGKSGLKI